MGSWCTSFREKKTKFKNAIKEILKARFGMSVWSFPHCSWIPPARACSHPCLPGLCSCSCLLTLYTFVPVCAQSDPTHLILAESHQLVWVHPCLHLTVGMSSMSHPHLWCPPSHFSWPAVTHSACPHSCWPPVHVHPPLSALSSVCAVIISLVLI
jgi:hypothetical protein